MTPLQLDVFTLVPHAFSWLTEQRPVAAVLGSELDLRLFSYRDTTPLRAGQVDDEPYGGGAGMVLRVDTVAAALDAAYGGRPEHRVVALTPQGRQLTQQVVEELAQEEHLTLLSARFEGFDERIVEHLCSDAISIGPYVLSNGDLPAMVLVDAIARRLPGALAEGSGELESFSDVSTASSSTRTTRGPPSSAGGRCPRFCSRATTARSSAGARSMSGDRRAAPRTTAPARRSEPHFLASGTVIGGRRAGLRARIERHGRRLPRDPDRPEPARGAEGARTGAARRRRLPRALRPRVAARRLAPAPEHPSGLRGGRRRRPRAFQSMQYVDGGDLGAELARNGAMPAARAVAIARQIALALSAAHAAGLVHRDVQAGEHPARRRRPRLPVRLRPRARGELPRDVRVRRARAARGQAGRRAHRPVQPRLRALPLPRRTSAVRSRRRGRRDEGAAARRAAAARRPGRSRPGSKPS